MLHRYFEPCFHPLQVQVMHSCTFLRLQKSQNLGSNRPSPESHPARYPENSSSPRLSSQQQGQGLPPTVRPSSAQSLGAPQFSSRPPRSRPTSSDIPSVREEDPHAPHPPHISQHPPAALAPAPSTPTTPQGPSQQSLHPAAVAPRPVGRGPKTFDEMGVPQASKESECVGSSLPSPLKSFQQALMLRYRLSCEGVKSMHACLQRARRTMVVPIYVHPSQGIQHQWFE